MASRHDGHWYRVMRIFWSIITHLFLFHFWFSDPRAWFCIRGAFWSWWKQLLFLQNGNFIFSWSRKTWPQTNCTRRDASGEACLWPTCCTWFLHSQFWWTVFAIRLGNSSAGKTNGYLYLKNEANFVLLYLSFTEKLIVYSHHSFNGSAENVFALLGYLLKKALSKHKYRTSWGRVGNYCIYLTNWWALDFSPACIPIVCD